MAIFNDIMDLLVTGAGTILKSSSYNTNAGMNVITLGRNLTNISHYPALSVTPNGTRQIVVEDDTDIRYSHEIEFVGVVQNNDQSEIREELLGLSADISKMIYSPVSLGSTCLAIYFEDEDIIVLEAGKAFCHQRYRLIYVEASAKTDAGPGSDVYGSSDVYADCVSKIYTQLNTLMAAMTALDPTFSYLYTDHHKANLQLNGVSIGIEPSESEMLTMSSATADIKHSVSVGLRIHTAYMGGQMI